MKKDITFCNSSILSLHCQKKIALNALIFLEILYSVCKFFANKYYFTAQDDLKNGTYWQ